MTERLHGLHVLADDAPCWSRGPVEQARAACDGGAAVVQLRAKRAGGEFLECAEVHGSGFWYGTLKSELSRAHQQGCWAFLEIDVQGALRVMEEYPEAVTIFLKTSSEAEFERRLRARGTEAEDVIQRRLATARAELTIAERYRYQVVNDDLETAVQEIADILISRENEFDA